MSETTCTNIKDKLLDLGKMEITEEHIKTGVRGDPEHCPLANAFRSAGFENVKVFPNGVQCDNQILALGEEVAEIVDKFDMSGEMEPRTLFFNYADTRYGYRKAEAPTELKR